MDKLNLLLVGLFVIAGASVYADLDGDSYPDWLLTSVSPNGTYIGWFEFDPISQTLSWQANLWYESQGEFSDVDFAYIDGNASPDILATSFTPNGTYIGWFEFDPSTSNTIWRTNLWYEPQPFYTGIDIVPDLDGDAYLDVFTTVDSPPAGSTFVQWFEMNSGMTALQWRKNWLPGSNVWTGVAGINFGDNPDLYDPNLYHRAICTIEGLTETEPNTWIALCNYDGKTQYMSYEATLYEHSDPNAEFTGCAVTDIDGDAALDVVVTLYIEGLNANYVQWYEMNNDNTHLLWQANLYQEFQGKITGIGVMPSAICISPPIADLDGDCLVGMSDFAVLSNQWLGIPGDPSADIDPPGGDGQINLDDLAAMASEWLVCGFDVQQVCF